MWEGKRATLAFGVMDFIFFGFIYLYSPLLTFINLYWA